jgi:hypothetical protein
METLWVDFQNAGFEGVRLICKGTLDELRQKNLTLHDGLKLLIWTEDQDDDGKEDNLLVEAVVKYSDVDRCWVASFDADKLMNESQRKEESL